MALPVPRSFQQILSDMVDALVSDYGIESLRVGGPILATLEAAAQSDLRNTQDMFSLLNSTSLDRCNGIALDRIGADENVIRFQESPATGYVTVSDSSFDKVSSTLYQGAPAPIAGSFTICVRSALIPPWAVAGSLYIGRGTPNYEGPLIYDSIALVGNYYEITLNAATPTTRFHNVGETVTMAQGGDRTIAAGTIVQTTASSTMNPVSFSVVYGAIIPDGEVSVENVLVSATLPGVSGNVSAGIINQFSSAPFSGAEVTNPLPFTNALAAESDDLYRDRIKVAKQTRTKGTVLSIESGVLGIIATDENKRVVSSNLLTRPNEAAVLYIDDGNGYEERDLGVAFETLMDSATGGEQYFQLRGSRPVAKARLVSSFASPFNFGTDIATMNARSYVAKLAVSVGGVETEHVFEVTDFVSPSNASAYEIVASINGDPLMNFSARTTDSGTRVVLFAKGDTNEDIQMGISTADLDANTILGFSATKADTLKLYRDNELLVKDGYAATLTSNPKGYWNTPASPQTLTLSIDGTPATTYTITDSHFVDAGTGYALINNLVPLTAWATVLNYVIPGITARVESGTIVIESNLGADDRAALAISGGTLVSGQAFVAGSSTGKSSDYELDRNLGQIKLIVPLAAGQMLTAGSEDTRAFIETDDFTTITPALGPDFWFIVDSPSTVVHHDLIATSELVVTSVPFGFSPGSAITITENAANPIFSDVAVGDWVVFWDDVFVANGIEGAWRVSARTDASITYESGDAAFVPPIASIYALDAGISFARSNGVALKVGLVGGAAVTPTDFAALFSSVSNAIEAWVLDNRVRFSTWGFGPDASIALIAQNVPARVFGLTVGDSVSSYDSHRASVLSESCLGVPHVLTTTQTYDADPTHIINISDRVNLQGYLLGARTYYVADPRFETNRGFFSAIKEYQAPWDLTSRWPAPQAWTGDDIVAGVNPVVLSAYDTLSVLVDGDSQSKSYNINMFRNVVPADANYSDDILLEDNDYLIAGVPQSLSKSFGNGFLFEDFALFMRARAKSHSPGGVDNTSTVLWRAKEFGLDGTTLNVMYEYPLAESQPTSFSFNRFADTYGGTAAMSDVRITLPSGAAHAMALRNCQRIGISRIPVATGLCRTHVVFGLVATSASVAAGKTILTLSFPAGVVVDGAVTVGGLSVGDFIHFDGAAGYAAGNYTITDINPGTNQISYLSADVGPGPDAINAAVTTDTLSTTGQSYTMPPALLNGDIAYVGPTSGLPSFSSLARDYKASGRVENLASYSFSVLVNNGSVLAASTNLAWYAVADIDAFKVFPLDSAANCATDVIVAAINAIDLCPVTGVAVSNGVMPLVFGDILLATWDELSSYTACRYPLVDGVRYVKTAAQPGGVDTTYQLLLKDVCAHGSLQNNADWANEELRLVPVTHTNFVDYMNSLGVTGLSSSADVALADDKHKIQITTLTSGAAGSVKVEGGNANSTLGSALGSPDLGTTAMAVPVRRADAEPLDYDQWVKLLNASGGTKAGRFLSTTNLATVTNVAGPPASIRLTLGVEDFFTATQIATAEPVIFEKTGRLVSCCMPTATTTMPAAGNWVWIYGAGLSAGNRGFFRVVNGVDDAYKTFFIENASAINEVATVDVWEFPENSVLPGDTLIINTDKWGAQMHHEWTVGSIGGDTIGSEATWAFANTKIIDLLPTYAVVNSAPAIALGTSAPLVRATEGSNPGWIKRIISVVPDTDDATKSWVKFADKVGASYITEGTTIAAMDRLGFSTDLVEGMDGYKYNTGLIREANKVVYGDERDPVTYPGIAAAGANININGPLIKRVSISLALRVRTGIEKATITERVKSAVAAAVNKIGVGESVAISDVVSAAASIAGVVSVTVLSPEYSTGHDLISIQAYEKPMVLDSNTDITISFVGV